MKPNMKPNLLFLFFSFISFEIHSMERLASLRALPVASAEEDNARESIALPNPPPLSPNMLLKLWQNPESKAQLELPLIEAKIKSLEKKHEKAKKAFNEQRENVIDQGMYGAGYLALSLFMDYTKKEFRVGGAFIFGENANLVRNFKYSLREIFDQNHLYHVDWGRVIFYGAAFLALKNLAQAGTNYYRLPSKPHEPKELIEAREKKAQLLLTLQQSEF